MTLLTQAAQAAMFGGSTAETVSLSGTLGSPRSALGVSFAPDAAVAIWLFAGLDSAPTSIVQGQAQKYEGDLLDPFNFVSDNPSTDWVQPNDFQNGPYYIRATFQTAGGDEAPSWPSSAALDTWHIMTNGFVNLSWGWQSTITGGSLSQGTIKVEIATDSGGTNIVATGYYRGVAATDL